MQVFFPPIATSASSWTLTFQATSRLEPPPPPTWPAVCERLVTAAYQKGSTSGDLEWRQALNAACADLRASLGRVGHVPVVLERLHDASARMMEQDLRQVWLLRGLRAITATPESRELVLTWLGRIGLDTAANRDRARLTGWAHAMPRLAARLVGDDRFWLAVGHDPYSRWGRVLDTPAQQRARLWSSLETSEQRDVRGSLPALRRLNVHAALQVQQVQTMERSGLLKREQGARWVDTWLDQAVEWGALGRVRAVLDQGHRLDHRPGHRSSETLRVILRGVFFDRAPGVSERPERRAFEDLAEHKVATWTALRRAGLVAPTIDQGVVERSNQGQGNGRVWRALVEDGTPWTPLLMRAFLGVQLQENVAARRHGTAAQPAPEARAGDLGAIVWAVAHGAAPDLWTPGAVIDMLGKVQAEERGAPVDALLGQLVQAGVRWHGQDHSREGLVVQAMRRGVSVEGLGHLVTLGADFRWQNTSGTNVLMGAIGVGMAAALIGPLLDHAVRRHGPAVANLLTHTSRLGLSALHVAASTGHLATVQDLLDRGLDAAARTQDGRTCLHLAVHAGVGRRSERSARALVALLQTLMAHGADPTLPDARGNTPLDLLVHAGPPSTLVPMLLPHVDRLYQDAPAGSWAQRLRERGESVSGVLETLDLHHTAKGAMLEPDHGRTVRRL